MCYSCYYHNVHFHSRFVSVSTYRGGGGHSIGVEILERDAALNRLHEFFEADRPRRSVREKQVLLQRYLQLAPRWQLIADDIHIYIHMYIRIKTCGGCLYNEIIMIRYIYHTCSIPDRTEIYYRSYNINFCIHTYIPHNSCIQFLDRRCDTENQICTFYALNSVLTLKRIIDLVGSAHNISQYWTRMRK